MLYNMPLVYDFNMPKIFANKSPQMALVLQNKQFEQTSWNHFVVLQSKGSQEFLSFAKYEKFDAGLTPFYFYYDITMVQSVFHISQMLNASWVCNQNMLWACPWV